MFRELIILKVVVGAPRFVVGRSVGDLGILLATGGRSRAVLWDRALNNLWVCINSG